MQGTQAGKHRLVARDAAAIIDPPLDQIAEDHQAGRRARRQGVKPVRKAIIAAIVMDVAGNVEDRIGHTGIVWRGGRAE
jgi:hypothetical protein